MGIDLNKLRLGHSSLTDKIYAGILKKGGKQWRIKTDATNDFLHCVLSRWSGKRETITSPDGKKYEIIVKEIKK